MVTSNITTNIETQKSHHLQIDRVEKCKNLFYQCQFVTLLETIDVEIKAEENLANVQKLIHLKAKSEFELNKRSQATQTLESCEKIFEIKKNSDYYYSKGSLEYFKGEFDLAKDSFKLMLELNNSIHNSFLALLSIANIHYSKKELENACAYIKELEKLSTSMQDEYKISLKLLKGNILLEQGRDLNLAGEIYEEVYQESMVKNWSYFANRSLYYLAKVLVKKDESDKALGVLKVLDLYLKTMDWRFMALLVNKEFKKINHVSEQKVEVNNLTKEIIIGSVDQYKINLSRWPSLFNLINLLFEKDEFVSKESIAKHLWPEQKYLPKTHDARIYDLMARLKKKIEITEEVSLLIETRNGGYRLNY